ncbi:MAG: hypothetical protein ACREQ5_38930, partial [Candidatus Dormibacteria bacterium]
MKRVVLSSAALAATVALIGVHAMQRGATEPVHASLLPTPDDSLRKLVLKFHVAGQFENIDPATGVVTFSFTGPFGATQINPVTGVVNNAQTGPQIGDIEHANVQFTIEPSKGLLNADSARFTCD